MRVALNGLFLESPATGTGQYLVELTRALRALFPADEFTLIARKPAPVGLAPQVYRPRLGHKNLGKVEFEQVTFPRAARDGGFTLAHVPHFGSPLLPSLPTVVTIHDLIPMRLPAYRGSPAVRLYTRLAAMGARRAAAILADSEASARDIAARLAIPRSRIQVVYLAAGAQFQPHLDWDEIERVRAKYHLPERFALYLGGFDIRKNVARVIQAFAGLDSERPSAWKLVIAGKLPERDTAFFPDPRVAAQRFDVVQDTHFPGFVADEDKPAVYAAARVMLFASRYEGFGLPPLEAMACGTPVICANTSSLPEIVGDAAILVAPDDAQGWRDALLSVLMDDKKWQEMRARGLEQANQFSWERAARATWEVYRRVVNRQTA